MGYDIDAIARECTRVGIQVSARTKDEIKLDLGGGAILVFANDSTGWISYFEESDGHWHGDLEFELSDPPRFLHIPYLQAIEALANGQVLIAEFHYPRRTDRRLMYYQCDSLTERLEVDEELRIRRAAIQVQPTSATQRLKLVSGNQSAA